jgi:hypothetical protein
MKGFLNTTKMKSGHAFSHPSTWFNNGHATGGTINRLAKGGRPRDKVPRGINGVDEHDDARTDDGNALENRGSPPPTEELKEAGGHSPLKPGFSKGGKAEKHFHVHHHYHGGKVKKGDLKKMEMQAESESPDRSEHYRSGGKKKSGIHIKAKNKGALHRDMGVPQGEKIPKSKIRAKLRHDKAEHNVKGERRDVFALNFGHADGGHIHDDTTPVAPDYATGGTINRLNAGGALYARGGHGKHHPAPRHRVRHAGPPPGALQALAALGNAAAGPRGPMQPPPGAQMPPGGMPGGPPPGLAARGGRMRSR